MIIFLSHELLQAVLSFGHDCSDTLSRSRQPKEFFWELRRLIVLCRLAPSEKSVCSWEWSLQMPNSSVPSQKFCRCKLDCLAVTRSFVCSLVYCGFCCFWVGHWYHMSMYVWHFSFWHSWAGDWWLVETRFWNADFCSKFQLGWTISKLMGCSDNDLWCLDHFLGSSVAHSTPGKCLVSPLLNVCNSRIISFVRPVLKR